MRTFDRSRRIGFAEKETLNFTFLQRQQYAPKAGHTVSLGLRKINRFFDLGHATFGVPSIQDAAGEGANLLVRNAGYIRRKSANQSFFHIRMQLRFELRPVNVVATDDEPLPDSFLSLAQQAFGHRPEVVHRLLGYVAFGMTGVIAIKAVTSSGAWQQVNHGLPFTQIV